MLKLINRGNSDLLVVTPLHKGDNISRATRIAIARNNLDFAWISYESVNSQVKNYDLGIKEYIAKYRKPKYVMMIEKDLIPARSMIDKMYSTLSGADISEVFCYCSFEVNDKKHSKLHYDPLVLLRGNYITLNSIITLDKLNEIGGLVTDDKYGEMVDWCLWLSFLSYGYYGIFCGDASFIIKSKYDTVSKEIFRLVQRDFIEPLIDGLVF